MPIYENVVYTIGESPQVFKRADIISVNNKNKSDKTNYRPVSCILPNHSKIYEELIYNQLYDYFYKILLPSQCGFRKGCSSQNCLLAMLENFLKKRV